MISNSSRNSHVYWDTLYIHPFLLCWFSQILYICIIFLALISFCLTIYYINIKVHVFLHNFAILGVERMKVFQKWIRISYPRQTLEFTLGGELIQNFSHCFLYPRCNFSEGSDYTPWLSCVSTPDLCSYMLGLSVKKQSSAIFRKINLYILIVLFYHQGRLAIL